MKRALVALAAGGLGLMPWTARADVAPSPVGEACIPFIGMWMREAPLREGTMDHHVVFAFNADVGAILKYDAQGSEAGGWLRAVDFLEIACETLANGRTQITLSQDGGTVQLQVEVTALTGDKMAAVEKVWVDEDGAGGNPGQSTEVTTHWTRLGR